MCSPQPGAAALPQAHMRSLDWPKVNMAYGGQSPGLGQGCLVPICGLVSDYTDVTDSGNEACG